MIEITRAAEFIAALADQLVARPGLEGVEVATAALGADHQAARALEFLDWTQSESAHALGNRRRRESITVRGQVWIDQAGNDEATRRAVRAEAIRILGELATQLLEDATANGTVDVALLGGHSVNQGVSPKGGRACRLDFTVTYESSLKGFSSA